MIGNYHGETEVSRTIQSAGRGTCTNLRIRAGWPMSSPPPATAQSSVDGFAAWLPFSVQPPGMEA